MQMLYYNHISLIVYNTLTASAVVSCTFAIIKYEGFFSLGFSELINHHKQNCHYFKKQSLIQTINGFTEKKHAQ